MTFDRPLALLALLLIPLCWWLVRQVMARRRRVVTTFLLLERARQKLPHDPPRSGRRSTWWRLLPLLLATLALASPRWTRDVVQRRTVVVDRSASMDWTTTDGPRWRVGLVELARNRPTSGEVLVTSVPPTDQNLVVETDSPLELLEVARAARARGDEVWVVTDQLLDVARGAGVLRVLGGGPNLGITRAAGDAEGRLFVRVEGDPQALPRTLRMVSGPTEFARFLVDKVPFEVVTDNVALRCEEVSISLVGVSADALISDDAVELLGQRALLTVSVKKDAFALARAFAANPAVQLVTEGDAADLVVIGNETAAPNHVRARLLVAPDRFEDQRFGPARPVRGAPTFAGELASLSLLEIEGSHVRSVIDPLPAGVVVLARLGEAPLLLKKGNSFVLLQDPEVAIAWTKQPSFPLLMAAIAGLITTSSSGLRAETAGEELTVIAGGQSDVTWVTPRNRSIALAVREDGRVRCRPVTYGRHRFTQDGKLLKEITVFPLSDHETAGAASGPLELQWSEPTEAANSQDAPSLVPWLLALATVGLVAMVLGRR